MRYPGSKARYTKDLVRLISERKDNRSVYLEPFLGGANSFSEIAPLFEHKFAGDAHEDIALMWDAVSEGWLPPETILESEYEFLRSAEPSALRGYAGIGCSFGGKWFGGYGRISEAQAHRNGGSRVAAEQSFRALKKQAPSLSGANIFHRSFNDWNNFVSAFASDLVVYCDPPYLNTLEYDSKTNHQDFWETMDTWSDLGAVVLVSEQTAPDNWECIYRFSRLSKTAKADVRSKTDEFVFERSIT